MSAAVCYPLGEETAVSGIPVEQTGMKGRMSMTTTTANAPSIHGLCQAPGCREQHADIDGPECHETIPVEREGKTEVLCQKHLKERKQR